MMHFFFENFTKRVLVQAWAQELKLLANEEPINTSLHMVKGLMLLCIYYLKVNITQLRCSLS
jgi:hypothetical protein